MSLFSERRIGTFRIDHHFLDMEGNEAGLLAFFGACVIVRAESLFAEREVEYTAFSKHFRQVKDGERTPVYIVEITRHEDGTYTFAFKEAERQERGK